MPLANLQDDINATSLGSSLFGIRNSSTSPCMCHQHHDLVVTRCRFVPNQSRKICSVPTLMACCMNSIAIRRPKSSPAKRVNLLMIEQAPKMANRKSKNAVQTHTLRDSDNTKDYVASFDVSAYIHKITCSLAHHPVHARNMFRPRSARSLTKLNMKVYMSTVGSATPRISRGCPPMMECMMPQSAVDARV